MHEPFEWLRVTPPENKGTQINIQWALSELVLFAVGVVIRPSTPDPIATISIYDHISRGPHAATDALVQLLGVI